MLVKIENLKELKIILKMLEDRNILTDVQTLVDLQKGYEATRSPENMGTCQTSKESLRQSNGYINGFLSFIESELSTR